MCFFLSNWLYSSTFSCPLVFALVFTRTVKGMFINKCLFFCLNYGSMSKLGDGIVFNDFSVLKPEKKSET